MDYVAEAIRLLSDDTTYIKLKKDPTAEFAHEANILVKSALETGVINKTEASFFQMEFYQIPYFYHLLKVHTNSRLPQAAQ